MAVDSKDGGQQLKKPYHPLFLSVNVGQLRKPSVIGALLHVTV